MTKWGRVRKCSIIALWSAVVLLSGSVVAAWLLPQRLTYARQPYLAAASLAFYIHAFQFHLGLLGVLLTIGALTIRRWKLAGVGAIGAVVALLPSVPQFMPKSPPPVAGPTVRVMSVNLLWSNRNIDWLMQGLRSGDADVIIMQEYTNAMDPLLRERLRDYPHVAAWPRDGSDGSAVYSRLPLVRD